MPDVLRTMYPDSIGAQDGVIPEQGDIPAQVVTTLTFTDSDTDEAWEVVINADARQALREALADPVDPAAGGDDAGS